jgi:hypothetical protein
MVVLVRYINDARTSLQRVKTMPIPDVMSAQTRNASTDLQLIRDSSEASRTISVQPSLLL